MSETEDKDDFVQRAKEKGHHKKARGGSKQPIRDDGSIHKHAERRVAPQFYVEVGPGSYKSAQVTYPPDYLKNQLLKLLRLKEKRDRLRASEVTTANSAENSTEVVTGEEEEEGTTDGTVLENET